MALTKTSESHLQLINGDFVSPSDSLSVELPTIDLKLTTLIGGVACIAGANVPYTMEIPAEISDPVPAVIVPGYGGIKPAYRNLRHSIALMGKPAVSYRPPRTQSPKYALRPSHLLHPEKLPSQATWGVMRDIIDRDDIPIQVEQFDLDAHSMGGLTASETALHKAKYVRSMIFVASAGLSGHSRLSLLGRVPGFINHDILHAFNELHLEDNAKAALHVADYVFRNPPRTFLEGWMLGGCDIRESIKSLGDLGIRTAVLAFAKDPFFDISAIRNNATSIVDLFVEYSDPEAGHTPPQIDPQGVASSLVEIHRQLAA